MGSETCPLWSAPLKSGYVSFRHWGQDTNVQEPFLDYYQWRPATVPSAYPQGVPCQLGRTRRCPLAPQASDHLPMSRPLPQGWSPPQASLPGPLGDPAGWALCWITGQWPRPRSKRAWEAAWAPSPHCTGAETLSGRSQNRLPHPESEGRAGRAARWHSSRRQGARPFPLNSDVAACLLVEKPGSPAADL